MIDFQNVLNDIHANLIIEVKRGSVASKIPELSNIDEHSLSFTISGGITTLLPNHFTITAWSPGLNEKGNSFMEMQTLEQFTTKPKL